MQQMHLDMLPILEYLWQFAPTASHLLGLQQVSFHTIHQSWHINSIQRLSSALKHFSNTGKFSIPLRHPPANLKNKPLIYNFSKFSRLNHTNSHLHLPSPNSMRCYQLLPAPRLGLPFPLDFEFLFQAHSAVLKLMQLLSPCACTGCPPEMTIASISYEMSHGLQPAFSQMLLHFYLELSSCWFPRKI